MKYNFLELIKQIEKIEIKNNPVPTEAILPEIVIKEISELPVQKMDIKLQNIKVSFFEKEITIKYNEKENCTCFINALNTLSEIKNYERLSIFIGKEKVAEFIKKEEKLDLVFISISDKKTNTSIICIDNEEKQKVFINLKTESEKILYVLATLTTELFLLENLKIAAKKELIMKINCKEKVSFEELIMLNKVGSFYDFGFDLNEIVNFYLENKHFNFGYRITFENIKENNIKKIFLGKNQMNITPSKKITDKEMFEIAKKIENIFPLWENDNILIEVSEKRSIHFNEGYWRMFFENEEVVMSDVLELKQNGKYEVKLNGKTY